MHYIIEEKKGIQFILTGSSARKLKRDGVNLLAGRAIKKSLHPFIASEIKDTFKLKEALKYGMLPLVLDSKNRDEVLETYVNLYIMEEVQFEGLIRNIGNFSRFLSVIAFSHGNTINLNNIARECEVKRTVVEGFIKILEDLLIAYQIPIFKKRAKRILTSHPKFYLFDSGVFRILRKLEPMDTPFEIDGNALEGLVLQHLKAFCDYSSKRYEIFYWRTKAGVEVDFIVYGEDGFWAIEVKNSTKISSKDVRGLFHFSKDYPECKVLLLYRGKEKIMEKNILCMPCEEFLKKLAPNKALF